MTKKKVYKVDTSLALTASCSRCARSSSSSCVCRSNFTRFLSSSAMFFSSYTESTRRYDLAWTMLSNWLNNKMPPQNVRKIRNVWILSRAELCFCLQKFKFIHFFRLSLSNFVFVELIIRLMWGGLAPSIQTVGSLYRWSWPALLQWIWLSSNLRGFSKP